jgi:hypothetical protein
MIPNLVLIITVYCLVRFAEMGLTRIERKSGIPGFTAIIVFLCVVGALIIAACCADVIISGLRLPNIR